MPLADKLNAKIIAANARKLRRQGQPVDVAITAAFRAEMEEQERERERRKAAVPPIPKHGRAVRSR